MVAYLRAWGVWLIYLDNLLMAQDRPPSRNTHQIGCDLLQGLGFLLNIEKSTLLSSTTMEFLGFRVDLVSLSLSSIKLRTIHKEIRRTLVGSQVTLRYLAKVFSLAGLLHPGPLPVPLSCAAAPQKLPISAAGCFMPTGSS